MNSNKIFIGNIMGRIYNNISGMFMPLSVTQKENAVLIKTKNGFYVDVEELYNGLADIAYLYVESYEPRFSDIEFIDYMYRLIEMPTDMFRGRWMTTNPLEYVHIDEDSLRPYCNEEQNVSISKLRRELASKK